MKGLSKFLLCVLVVTFARSVEAQTDNADAAEEFVIDFIGVRDGLISNYVTKTVNDRGNLKYFATEGGLSRFDGYSFKSYQPGEAYPGLLNENIETLFRDVDNNIWIGTKSGGLAMLDVQHDKIRNFNALFTEIKTDTHMRVVSINQDATGNIWIGTWADGVFVIDWKAERLLHHYPFNTPIRNMIRDKYDDIW